MVRRSGGSRAHSQNAKATVVTVDTRSTVNWWILTRFSRARAAGMHLAEARPLEMSQAEPSQRIRQTQEWNLSSNLTFTSENALSLPHLCTRLTQQIYDCVASAFLSWDSAAATLWTGRELCKASILNVPQKAYSAI